MIDNIVYDIYPSKGIIEYICYRYMFLLIQRKNKVYNILFNMIEGNWSWVDISMYSEMEQVRRNPDKSWSRVGLSENKALTISDIDTLKLPNATGIWAWSIISKYINIDQVRMHPDREWNRKCLSRNRGITLSDVLHLEMPNAEGEWDWRDLSMMINPKDIITYRSLPWSYPCFSLNKSMSIEDLHILCGKKSINWDLVSEWASIDMIYKIPSTVSLNRKSLSINPNLTLSFIRFYNKHTLANEWDWNYISANMDMEMIRKHNNMPWTRYGLSKNKGITLSDVLNLHLPRGTGEWKWYELSRRIPLYLIHTYPEGKWIKDSISSNPYLTLSDIEKIERGYIPRFPNVYKDIFLIYCP